MACPLLRQCSKWNANCSSLFETLWYSNGRSVSFSTSSLGRTSWSSGPGNEGQPSALRRRTGPNTFNFTTSLTRHKLRLLDPSLKSCFCINSAHTDVKVQDPFTIAQEDLTNLYDDIRKELFVTKELKALCHYYFDGKGKAIRPMIVVLMARALNSHSNRSGELLPGQRAVAMITEMIHTASLVHDDVIDGSNRRRGKGTINELWGEKKAILAGDFILSRIWCEVNSCSWAPKRTRTRDSNTTWRKPFKKTASLIANSCKAVCVLVSSDPKVHEIAYQYGKNVGIAFQLVDDVLDFTSKANHLGKPSAADLKLGLATGPVLFACQQFPELHSMIMRRFSSKGDVDQAWQYVFQSDGVEQTKNLAQHYCQEAIRQISMLRPSAERDALIRLTEMVLTRDK
ncbi:hypothetical protein CesoFtcFv8_025612 [Champsocephalus esox]|uniref:Decaprenyl-diphosphate synthase subunit 1 n=1 Tax=Champsocephalus esox TaxID=159716 RepID=A0AAN8GFB9_9TELE|nr:hypothetical protein CesoFtcFv8_025612 [Champsocephalus esox]